MSNHAAVIQHRDFLADTHNEIHIVFDEQDSNAELVTDAAHRLHEFFRLIGVHAGGRFIQQQQFRVRCQSAGNLQLALLAVGQLDWLCNWLLCRGQRF